MRHQWTFILVLTTSHLWSHPGISPNNIWLLCGVLQCPSWAKVTDLCTKLKLQGGNCSNKLKALNRMHKFVSIATLATQVLQWFEWHLLLCSGRFWVWWLLAAILQNYRIRTVTTGRTMPFLPCALQRHLMHVHVIQLHISIFMSCSVIWRMPPTYLLHFYTP